MPPSSSHTVLLKVFFAVVVVIILAVGGYFLYQYMMMSAPYSSVDVAYAVSSSSGSTWYEIHDGRITAYPALSGETITGISRGGGKIFVLGTSGSSSTIYVYNPSSKAYMSVYKGPDAAVMTEFSVDSNGVYAVFDANQDVQVLNLTTKKLANLGSGMSPVIVGSTQENVTVQGKSFSGTNGYMAVVYESGKTIEATTLHANRWGTTITAYTSQQPFSVGAPLATDGAKSFAFIEPAINYAEVWNVTTPDPFTIASKNLYAHASAASALTLSNGSLVGLTLMPPTAQNSTQSVKLSTFSTQSNGTSGVQIPLKAAGKSAPSFVGFISS